MSSHLLAEELCTQAFYASELSRIRFEIFFRLLFLIELHLNLPRQIDIKADIFLILLFLIIHIDGHRRNNVLICNTYIIRYSSQVIVVGNTKLSGEAEQQLLVYFLVRYKRDNLLHL